jgi:hypothetical protein
MLYLFEHIIGQTKRALKRCVLGNNLEQSVVGDDNECVHTLFQGLNGGECLLHPAPALECERLRHHTYRQRSGLQTHVINGMFRDCRILTHTHTLTSTHTLIHTLRRHTRMDKYSYLFGDGSHNGSRAAAGASAHARCDKHQVRTRHRL